MKQKNAQANGQNRVYYSLEDEIEYNQFKLDATKEKIEGYTKSIGKQKGFLIYSSINIAAFLLVAILTSGLISLLLYTAASTKLIIDVFVVISKIKNQQNLDKENISIKSLEATLDILKHKKQISSSIANKNENVTPRYHKVGRTWYCEDESDEVNLIAKK